MTEQQQANTQNDSQTNPGQPSYQAPPPPYGQAQGQPQGQTRPPYRRLTRTSWDAPVSGVCGGIARYLGVDPTLIRVLAVIAMVLTFPAGPIAYAVLWAVIPQE